MTLEIGEKTQMSLGRREDLAQKILLKMIESFEDSGSLRKSFGNAVLRQAMAHDAWKLALEFYEVSPDDDVAKKAHDDEPILREISYLRALLGLVA